jgi:hypothetical protein
VGGIEVSDVHRGTGSEQPSEIAPYLLCEGDSLFVLPVQRRTQIQRHGVIWWGDSSLLSSGDPFEPHDIFSSILYQLVSLRPVADSLFCEYTIDVASLAGVWVCGCVATKV